MALQKPKFQNYDKISPVGTPGSVFVVTNVQTNTDGRVNRYTLEAPDGTSHTESTEVVDKSYRKDAHEFNRQLAKITEEPVDPDFDGDGFPTFESERRP